uniref:Leucine-rich repeat-containing N-terminal plant-type domain-containing protein n=1 Tax=Manihot esculenta TaxID=3983 RepID=A0A2C9W1M7_MANES
MELANIAKWLVLVLLMLLLQIHRNNGCFEEERLSLLDFKGFVGSDGSDADHLLPSWVDDSLSNYCKWERITCNSTTGHVTHLFLNNSRQYDINNDAIYDDENIWFLKFSMFPTI